MAYNNIKSHKKTGLPFFSRKHTFGKTSESNRKVYKAFYNDEFL